MLRMTFQEIESVLDKLPPSAWKHQAWWSNNTSHTHARHGWLSAGWETSKVDMEKQELLFVRASPAHWGKIQSDFSPLNLRRETRRRSAAGDDAKLAELVRRAGGVENLSEMMVAIDRYISGDIVETELGRLLRMRWPR
jgi:hypothetical protein